MIEVLFCWQVFVCQETFLRGGVRRGVYFFFLSALHLKVMQLHVKILSWQQKWKWLSSPASQLTRRRKCFILKLSTLYRTLEHERKCWGEEGLKRKNNTRVGFLSFGKTVSCKMSLSGVFGLVSFRKGCELFFSGFKMVCHTSCDFSTPHSYCLNL